MSIPLPRFHPAYSSGHPLASPAAMLAVKDPRDPFVHRTVPPGGPYSPAAFAAYHPYLYGLEGGLRKAAVRETTGPLKAWLLEHKKNPYPTKAEKLMLAIITHMSLTQVSTWFANARRRLKKENKGGWESACSADLDNVSVTDQDGDKGEADNGLDNDYSDVSDDNTERCSTPPPAVAGPEHEAAGVGSRLHPPAETARDDLPQALRQYHGHFHHPALHPYTAHVLMLQPQRHDVPGSYSLSHQTHGIRPEVMSTLPPRTVLPAAFPHRQDVAAPLALRPGLVPGLPRRPELPAPSARSPEERALLTLREAHPWEQTNSDLLQPLLWPPQLGGHGQGLGLSPGTAGPMVSPRGTSSSKPRIWSIANILGTEPDTGDDRAGSQRGETDPRVGGAVPDVTATSDDTAGVKPCKVVRKRAHHTDSSSEASPGVSLRSEERTGPAIASEHAEVNCPIGKRDPAGSAHSSPRHSPFSHSNHSHNDINTHLHS